MLLHTTGEKSLHTTMDTIDGGGGEEEGGEGGARARGGGGAEEQLSCMAIFSALDSLQEWRSAQRKRSDTSVVECIDALLNAVSYRKLAQAALHCGAHCRSLLYMEQSLDQSSPVQPKHFLAGKDKEQRQLTLDDAAQMHAAYVRTDEPDGLLALAKLRAQPSLEEEVLEHESHGRYSAALNCYQVALQQHRRLPKQPSATTQAATNARAGASTAAETCATGQSLLRWQTGLCRSLRCLGLFVSMRDSAESMLRTARDELERQQLRPCALQAAWRLGEWDDVQRLLRSSPPSLSKSSTPMLLAATGGIASFETELARAMLALHHSDRAALERHCSAARLSLVPLIAAAGMESYGRAHIHLTQLEALQELEAAARLLLPETTFTTPAAVDPDDLAALIDHWQQRLRLLPDTPQALEPILAVRCAIFAHPVALAPGDPVDANISGFRRAGLAMSWLAFAKGARAAGHGETAANALAQVALYDAGSAALKAAKMDWEAGRSHQAILRLQQQQRVLSATEDKPARAKTLIRLARYLEHERGLSEPQTNLDLLREASKLQPDWEKCHFWLGRFMDRLLSQALLNADRTEIVQHGQQPGHRSEFAKRKTTPQERQKKMLDAYVAHLHQALRYYGTALKKGMRHSALALPRMLTLWLDFADLQLSVPPSAQQAQASATKRTPDQMHDTMAELMQKVPLHQWLPATAQLVSRICHRHQRVREMIHAQLAKLLAEFPRQLVWAVIPASLSTIAERKRYGESIVVRAKQQLMSAAPGLQELMGNASRLIDQLRKVCNDCSMDKREKRVKMRTRWANLYRMTDLQVVVPLHSSLTVSEPDTGVSVANHEPFAATAPTIESWADEVDVMGSLQRPKKVTIHGSDGG